MMMRVWMAPGGLHIEPGQQRDAAALAKLHAASFYRGWTREDFAAWLIAQDHPTYVAVDAKRNVAGFAMLRMAADEAELLTIAVDRRRRGKGVGAALLEAVFADLMMTPVRRLFLEVAEDNAPAVTLYRHRGFADIGTRQGYYPRPDGTPATALVMARDLG